MPFVSQKQRALFYAARGNPSVRKEYGISEADAEKMVSHDEGGKLPNRVTKALAKGHRKRGQK